MTKSLENAPKALDAIADVVLAYKPNPKSKPAKKRKKLAAKMAKIKSPDSSQTSRRRVRED
jgi:hypothetical protein